MAPLKCRSGPLAGCSGFGTSRLAGLVVAVAGDVLLLPVREHARGNILLCSRRSGCGWTGCGWRRAVPTDTNQLRAKRFLHEEVPLLGDAVLQVAVEARFGDAVDRGIVHIRADRQRERRRVGEAVGRNAVRVVAVRNHVRAAAERGGAVVVGAGEVAGVARQVGDAEAAAQHQAGLRPDRPGRRAGPSCCSACPTGRGCSR